MASDLLYELYEINHSYKDFTLNIPELKINRGTSCGLSGPNGSGKSTLMRLMSFLEKPNAGRIVFNNISADRVKAAMLQQDPYLLKRSVYENVSYGLKIKKDYKDIKKCTAEVLETVNLDSNIFMNRKWFELSGGEQKRVALASRLILKPEALLLDEPTANVDAESSKAIVNAIKRMRDEYSITLIISSHDLTWLNSVTDHIHKLYNGKFAGSGNANIITGPWIEAEDNLWYAMPSPDCKIFSAKPQDCSGPAVLYPHDITISEEKISGISAINNIEAKVKLLSEEDSGRIRLEADVSGFIINCHITAASCARMNIVPGKKIYLIFKATSLIQN
jgi:tungstate transport system ATP-binding protein